MKIEPQIALIVKYLFDSFFVVLSAFKDDFQTFSHNNSWLTCLNPCTIESKMQEYHKKLKSSSKNA